MRTIVRAPRPIDTAQYKMRRASEADVSEVVRGSFTLMDERGNVKLAYYVDDWSDEEHAVLDSMFAALCEIRYERGQRSEGLVSTSRTFGWKPRLEYRQDFCSAASLAYEQPEQHTAVVEAAPLVADRYEQANPWLYRRHAMQAAAKMRPEYQLEDEVFTSGIINENNPLAYHFDTGNFRGVWSGMLAFRRNTTGGYLALPAYDLAVAIEHKSLFLFDGQAILHGVTPIKLLTPDAKRYSVVYYSLRRMWECETISDEVVRARRARTTREEQRAEKWKDQES